MPKRVVIYIGLALALFTALLLFLFLEPEKRARQSKKSNVDAFDNWEESYMLDESNATGVSLFNELLEFKTKKPSILIENKLDSTSLADTNTTYIFIGNQFQLKTDEFDSIIDRVKNGTNLFLAYKDISSNIFEYFFKKSGFMWDYEEKIALEIDTDSTLNLSAVFQGDTIAIPWNVYNFSQIKEEDNEDVNFVYSLSEIRGYSNFLAFEIGLGTVYLHSNPELFQNYQLLSKNGYTHSQFVIENIVPEYHQIKWLELGRFESQDAVEEILIEKENSYLQIIFDRKALTIALLVTLLGVILFLIFRTKRSQPIVPYIPKSYNQSLTFAETIKEIYFKQQTPLSILKVMKKNFYIAVNKQFFIDISKSERDAELKSLSEKTGIKLDKLKEFIQKIECKHDALVDYKFLEEVSHLQQEFYLKTGIIKPRLQKKLALKSMLIQRKILVPILQIAVGLPFICAGFLLLSMGKPYGVISLIAGIAFIFAGLLMVQLPILTIKDEEIVFHKTPFSKKTILKSDLSHVTRQGDKVFFTTNDNQVFALNKAIISKYDQAKFDQFIFPLIDNTLL